MSWIKTINENDASGVLYKIYSQLIEDRGKVSNILKVQSLNPKAMKAHLDLYMSLMFGKCGLSREEREMIAVAVSKANNCPYCIKHHSAALNFYWKDEEKTLKFAEDYKSLKCSERKTAMLEYAVKLTLKPYEVKEEDVTGLRKSGLTDEDILNINMIVSYFNFANRIVLGLGVEYTKEESAGYKY